MHRFRLVQLSWTLFYRIYSFRMLAICTTRAICGRAAEYHHRNHFILDHFLLISATGLLVGAALRPQSTCHRAMSSNTVNWSFGIQFQGASRLEGAPGCMDVRYFICPRWPPLLAVGLP